jgi:hypothetical protein
LRCGEAVVPVRAAVSALGLGAWFDRRARLSRIEGANLDRPVEKTMPVFLSSLIDAPAEGAGAFRRAGFANIAHARRYYGRDDQLILSLYGYT